MVCVNAKPIGYLKNCVKNTKGDSWGWGWWTGGLGLVTHMEIHEKIGQRGPAIEHRELDPVFCDNLCGKRTWKRMGVFTCITELTCCIEEIISSL